MKNISTFLMALVFFSFLFIAFPIKGYSGIPFAPGGPPCCQLEGDTTLTCNGGPDAESICNECRDFACEFFENATCVQQSENSASCVALTPNVPTVSHWGLIAIAVILGAAGFIVIRRKKIIA